MGRLPTPGLPGAILLAHTCDPAEAMHPIGGRRGVKGVIVAEDFNFAASSVVGDDVTGLATR
jgi:hypothetical protein